MEKRKIAVLTPVEHLDGVVRLLLSKGECTFLPDGNKEQVKCLLSWDKSINTIVCNPNAQAYVLDAEILGNSHVRTIITCSTGLNHIDMEACAQLGIEVKGLKDDMELLNQLPATAELSFTLMMNLLRKIPQATRSIARGEWNYKNYVGNQLQGKTVGIVGLGRLGSMMARYCEAFGAKVIFYDPYVDADQYEKQMTLLDLFEQSDIVSLHVHVKEDTIGFINESLWKGRKKSLYLINTSRGEIVNEEELAYALKRNWVTGYGTDVITTEFEPTARKRGKSKILRAKADGENIVVTPHVGGMTIEGQELAYKWAINKI